jgi:membrane protein implicated in regulation of membrane protease activity
MSLDATCAPSWNEAANEASRGEAAGVPGIRPPGRGMSLGAPQVPAFAGFKGWTMCHLIFLAPILTLPLFWLLPLSLALPIWLTATATTGLIMWPVVRALARPQAAGREAMVGIRGKALTDLNPEGLVRCLGEVWSASAEEPIAQGEQVRVLSVHRLRIRVGRQAPQAVQACPLHR